MKRKVTADVLQSTPVHIKEKEVKVFHDHQPVIVIGGAEDFNKEVRVDAGPSKGIIAKSLLSTKGSFSCCDCVSTKPPHNINR